MDSPSEQRAARRLHFVVSSVLVSLGIQLWVLGADRFHDFNVGFAFNACALLSVWLLCELVLRVVGQPRWLSLSFYPVILGLLTLIFAHTWFFDVAIERRLTVLDMTLSGTRYFFEVALPARGRETLLVALLLVFVLATLDARVRARLPWQPSLRARQLMVVALLLVCTPWTLRAGPVRSPLYDSAYELWQLATRPRIRADARPPSGSGWLGALDKRAVTRGIEPPRYKKVIVLVMETMTAVNFARESRSLPGDTFVRAERARSHRFERYFPNNQDSRTGMLDMLFSRLVPYEAYTDEGLSHYQQLARVPSLVERMHELSYATAFAVSQTTLEEVVQDLPWDRTLRLSERDVQAARAGHKLCFTPDEYEQSCEDLALLPQLIDFVAGHERAFVYQEFIWGHAAVYNEASGKSNAAYYSAYVDALRSGLKERGLLDDTLIALTSDHGFRDKGRQQELDVYRVPLWFHATDLTEQSDTHLLSHTDFGSLLFAHLAPRAAVVPEPVDNELVMIVGPTGQGHLFAIGREGGHMLMRHKAGRDVLLAHEGKLPLTPSALLALFQQYRAAFDQRMRRVPAPRGATSAGE
ncbi:MAG: hypothetical protein JWN04_1235 [Myxococcaceae bacterium]|nr:hypothetical protein [Myxococcaceae bacterium]